MSEYNELLSYFFNEKLLYRSNKKKHSKCIDCLEDKLFMEKSAPVDIEGGRGEIILSCGDTKSDKSKCGNKLRIILPKYSNDKDLNYFKNKLSETINWEIINKYIDIDSKLIQGNEILKQKYDEELNKLTELFKQTNDNQEKITDNYNEITSLKIDCNNILIKLNLPPDEIIEKKELKKQYIEKSNRINLLYSEIKNITNEHRIVDDNIRLSNENIQDYYLIEGAKIPVNKINEMDEKDK